MVDESNWQNGQVHHWQGSNLLKILELILITFFMQLTYTMYGDRLEDDVAWPYEKIRCHNLNPT